MDIFCVLQIIQNFICIVFIGLGGKIGQNWLAIGMIPYLGIPKHLKIG